MLGKIPLTVGAIDIESADVKPSSKILSISGAMIDVRTLELVSCMNVNINPEDPDNDVRSMGEMTMKWWENAGMEGNYPSMLARRVAWSGTTSLAHGLKTLKNWLDGLPKVRGSYKIAMKGPDFDYPILKDAIDQLDVRYVKLYGGDLDSSRTIETVSGIFDFPPLAEVEKRRVCRNGSLDEHISSNDAAFEALEAARTYHLLHLVATRGLPYATEQVKSWIDGGAVIPLEYEYEES